MFSSFKKKCAYFIIPLILLFPYSLHILFNENLNVLHSITFIFFFSVTIFSPKIGWMLTILSLTWFEHPLLIFNYPNHFLSDTTILAATTATWFKFKNFSGNYSNIFHHPFVLLLLMFPVIAFFQFIGMVSLWESLSPDGLILTNIFAMIGRNIQTWNITSNPIHNLSVAYGYIIQIFLIITVFTRFRTLKISTRDIIHWVICGSIVTFSYGVVQKYFPDIITSAYTKNIGATFQNGNHLSYYSGLIIILLSWFFYKRVGRTLALYLPAFFLAVWGLYIGKGRSPIIALLSAVILSHLSELLMMWFKPNKQKIKNKFAVAAPFLLCLFVGFGAWAYWEATEFYGLKELKNIIHNKNYTDIIFAGGRKEHYLDAWLAFKSNWLFGIGDGAFFSLSGLNYEIHNMFLKFAVGNGILPALVLLASFCFFFFKIIHSREDETYDVDRIWALTLAIYIFVSLLPDSFISYRSLLAVCSIILCSFIMLFDKDSNKSKLANPLAGILIVSVIIGCGSVLSPPRYEAINRVYRDKNFEKTLKANYRWYYKDLYVDLPKNKCITGKLFPFPPSEEKLPFRIGLVDKENLPHKYQSLPKYNGFIESELKQSISLQSRQWQDLCVCNQNSENSYFYLSSKYSEFLSLSKTDFGSDDRLISFGLSQLKVENPRSESDMNCTYL